MPPLDNLVTRLGDFPRIVRRIPRKETSLQRECGGREEFSFIEYQPRSTSFLNMTCGTRLTLIFCSPYTKRCIAVRALPSYN
jgi:hypothetical protein